MRFLSLCAIVLAMASCSNDDVLPTQGEGTTSQPQNLRTITCQAGSEGSGQSGRNEVKHNTSLSSHSVLWSEGDQFQIIKEGNNYILEATVTKTSSGLGIKSGQSNNTPVSTARVRYSAITVKVNGADVTSAVTNTSSSSNNTYKLGVYTSGGTYCYPQAGTYVTAEINAASGAIPIVQSSSSSSINSSNQAYVKLTNVEYSLNNGSTWTKLTSEDQLVNGFNNKNQVTHTLSSDGLNVTMTLGNGQAGHTVGTFAGTTSSSASLEGAMAVFPASALKQYVSGNLTISLPATQTYASESFDQKSNVMVGSVAATGENECNATFSNMCGLLRLALTGDNVALHHITLTDKAGHYLNGTATISAADYATTGITTTMLTDGTNTLTLNCDGVTLQNAEPTYFYFVAPAGALSSGFDLAVYTNDGRYQTISTSKANTISRNGIKAMPQLAINNLKSQPFNVENPAVQQYMSYGKYSSFGATSYFTTYSSVLNNSLCMDQDRPAEMTVTLPTSGSYTATLTDATKGKDVISNRSFTGSSYAFYNMVPGHSYTYTIKQGSTVVRTGSFEAGGLVRMVRIDDSFNCRDLGGWTGLGGHKVKYEWLYRTGSLNGEWQLGSNGAGANSTTIAEANNYRFSATGKQQVTDLGIMAELDLRGRTGDGGPWSSESGIHSRSILEPHIPIATADFKQIMTDLGLQQPLNNYAVVQDVAFIIDQVVNKNHPVAFHCKSGADRTGAVGMLLLSLLGVDQGDVARDYELTTMSREKKIFTGSSSFQTRLASNTSYGFFKNGFTTSSCQGSNAQEKAYYYLNQYFKLQGVAISAADLDAFIIKMLGLSSYTHPSFATNNSNTLSSIYNK